MEVSRRKLQALPPQHPDDRGPGYLLRQRQQIQDDVERRVPAADDQHALAGVTWAIAAQHVGNTVGNAIAVLALAGHRHAT